MGAVDGLTPVAPCAVPLGTRRPSPVPRRRRVLPELDAVARRGLVGIVIARLAVNGGIRVVYPFLFVIARGVGVSFEVIAFLVASRSLAGLAGPALARHAHDRHRRAMLQGLLLVVGACLLIIASRPAPPPARVVLVAAGFAATGLARPVFELPMQTWISAHVPANVRGRALGIAELGWALSLAVTVPTAGLLIGRVGWRGPFVLVVVLAVAGMGALLVAVPPDARRVAPPDARRADPPHPRAPAAARVPGAVARLPAASAICLGAALAVAAGEAVLVVYGRWLTHEFGMTVAQIGMSTLIIVAAELLGEGVIVVVSDRLGLRRTLFTALAVSLASYGALGLVGGSAVMAFAAVVTLFVAFEVSVVALIAFASTTARCATDRTRLLGRLMAGIACGNAVGAVVAPVAFAAGGIALAGGVSAVSAGVALVVLWVGSRPVPAPAR